MDNCFTFTYKQLLAKGYKIPLSWETWTVSDMRYFIKNYKWFLEKQKHRLFFESFCSYVKEAKENDIIINNNGVGIAINKFKYMTIRDRSNKQCICNIEKTDYILRINNG